MVFNPLDGIKTCRGGEGPRTSSTHCSREPLSSNCISMIYASMAGVIPLLWVVVHDILAIHGEMGVAMMSLGGKGGSGEETPTYLSSLSKAHTLASR